MLSSQSAIMWQCAFVFFALFAYIVGAIAAVRKNVPKRKPRYYLAFQFDIDPQFVLTHQSLKLQQTQLVEEGR